MPNGYRPAWWLPGPHAMTMWGKFFRPPVRLNLRTEQWATPDGDDLTVVQAGPSHGPTVILLHGLEGSIRSHYAPGILARVAGEGWTGVLLHFRTCDGRMNRARRTYHSGETGDLDMVIRRLVQQQPGRPLALAGVSLGANVLLKWLGETGDGIPREVRVAVAVSTPFDLARSSRHINSGFARLYQWNFLRSLRRKALAKLRDYPDVAAASSVAAARSLWAFDDAFTAPLHGFRDARDYYERCSSLGWLSRIRVRTLLLSAEDDPFHPPALLAEVSTRAAENPCLEVEFTRRGGHVGFVEGSPWAPAYYVERRIVEFIGTCLP